jgi:hypothetical protein
MKLFTGGIFEWKKTLILIAGLNIVTLIVIYVSWSKIPPLIPLYYGNPTGGEQLGPSRGLFIPPSFVLVSLLTAILITKAYKDDFLEKLLVMSLCVLTTLSTVTVLKILFLVGNF